MTAAHACSFLTFRGVSDTMSSPRTTIAMKQAADPLNETSLYPTTDLRPCARVRAQFLIFGYYTVKYGAEVQLLNPVQTRLKIQALQHEMKTTDDASIQRGLARTIADFERICMLQELLR